MWGLDEDDYGGELQQPKDYWQDDFHLAPWYEGGIPKLLPQAIKSQMLTLEVRDPARGNAALQKMYLWPAEAALEILDFIDAHNRFDKPFLSINIVSAGVLAPPIDGRPPLSIYQRRGVPTIHSSSDTAEIRGLLQRSRQSLGPQMLVHFVFFKGLGRDQLEEEVLDLSGTPEQRGQEMRRYKGYFVGGSVIGGLYALYWLVRLIIMIMNSAQNGN